MITINEIVEDVNVTISDCDEQIHISLLEQEEIINIEFTDKNGVDGKSNFELWKEIAGNENKSIEEYFASIKGEGTQNINTDFLAIYQISKIT